MFTPECNKHPIHLQCCICEDEAIYECLGCKIEICENCQSNGLCVECQGYSLRWPIDMNDVRVHGGDPKPIKEDK